MGELFAMSGSIPSSVNHSLNEPARQGGLGHMQLRLKALFLFSLLLFLAGCSSAHPLVATPNVFLGDSGYPAIEIPQELQTTSPDILYVTDRMAEQDKKGHLIYRANRSAAMVVGEITVQYGKGITWAELTQASQSRNRDKAVKLEIIKTSELVEFPATPVPFAVKDGRIVPVEPGASNYAAAGESFISLMNERLERANRKDVILFVHGFNNKFADAGLALADLWHFTGRVGVPIFYTWPAASGGLFGYFKDRESGEFTIFHLKELLRLLARVELLENLHIVAHSRGTDITTTALRELVIEARAAGINPLEKYRIANLFLAAPDLDFGVARQRLIAEKLGPAFGQITVYMNRNDGALGISQFLMSGLRFGRLDHDSLETQEREIFASVKNVNFISVEGVSGFFGHSYYRTHPGVLSDIAVAIRQRAAPGSLQRPLITDTGNFWILPKDYLLNKPSEPE